MRTLGIDHGTVRIGLALSDDLGLLARPLETVANELALSRIPELVRLHGIRTVVLGLPLRLDGSEGSAAERVRKFLAELEPALPPGTAVVLRDESLTTMEAEQSLRAAGHRDTRKVIDQTAAAVILQEHLDQQNAATIWLAPEDEDSA